MMKNLLFSICCLLLFLPFASYAQKTIDFKGNTLIAGPQLQILTDPASSIPLREAMEQPGYHAVLTRFPNLQNTPGSYWIRFNIRNGSTYKNLAVQLDEPMADYVDFYQLSNGKAVQSCFTGQRRPFDSRPIHHQSYIFPLEISPGNTGAIYLHVKSGKQLILPVYVGTLPAIVERAFIKDIAFGIYTGIILVMILYNCFVCLSLRDKSYLYYILYLVMVLLTQSAMEGYLFRFVLPGYPQAADKLIFITSALIGIAAIEFCKSFLSTRRQIPLLHGIAYVFWILYALQIALALAGKHNMSYTVMLITALTSALYVMLMAVVMFRKGSRAARYFLIAWSVFIGCVVIYTLKDFDVVFPYNDVTNAALLIGSAIESVLLSFALADRINILKRDKERSQEEALRTLTESARIIREQNELLEARVLERTYQLKEANHELERSIQNLQQAQSQLVESEKMASLGLLTAGIAHEINNPINFVSSNIISLERDVKNVLELLNLVEAIAVSETSPREKQRQLEQLKEEHEFDYIIAEIEQLVGGITEGANRTAEIVKELRIFSRNDEDRLIKADINKGLESTMIIANNLLNDKIKVVSSFGDIPYVSCLPGKLNQVFLNMVSNAAYAVQKRFGDSPGGEIRISTGSDGQNIFITFEDNGAGMEAEVQRKIFEPFFTTKEVGAGTGLGLYIAYNIIRTHNGRISVASEPDKGTTFVLQIPVDPLRLTPFSRSAGR